MVKITVKMETGFNDIATSRSRKRLYGCMSFEFARNTDSSARHGPPNGLESQVSRPSYGGCSLLRTFLGVFLIRIYTFCLWYEFTALHLMLTAFMNVCLGAYIWLAWDSDVTAYSKV